MPDGIRSNHGLHLLNEGARLLISNWVTEMESPEPRGGTERHGPISECDSRFCEE